MAAPCCGGNVPIPLAILLSERREEYYGVYGQKNALKFPSGEIEEPFVDMPWF
jgi:hypothetical protein